METLIIGEPGKKIFIRKYGHGKNKVLFFHGFPGSSIQAQVMESLCQSDDLEVIAFDRPGFGKSDWQSNRSLLDVKKIIQLLQNEFNLKKFSVVGVSGGAPYALATMSLFPDLILKKKIICGLGQLSEKSVASVMPKKSLIIMKSTPKLPIKYLNWISKKFLTNLVSKNNQPERSELMRLLFKASEADIQCLKDKNNLLTLNQSLVEAFSQGAQGPMQDLRIYTRPWKIPWSQLPEGIEFHHGNQDQIVPFEVSVSMQKKIRNSVLISYPQEGHYSLAINKAHDWWHK